MKQIINIALVAIFTAMGVSTHAQTSDSNFYACNSGYSTCNQALLTEEQKNKVYESALNRNFYACNSGYSTCNQTLLNDEQKSKVYQSTLNRNYYACNSGYSTCNQALLNDEQKNKVHQSTLNRNYYACNSGYSTCNQTLLTEEQKTKVNESALSRNFYACNNGYSTCNQSFLTEEQRQRLIAKSNNSSSATFSGTQKNEQPNPYPNSGGACAENGSCYGDISNITGLPKTTQVNGYYRKDGTYVRGHYRSHR